MAVINTKVSKLHEDPSNPRKPDQARLGLLRLSIAKLGFCMPVYATKNRMLLSGHQRLTVSKQLGITAVPVVTVDVKAKDLVGINILFNRATNDFTAFDTGSNSQGKLSLEEVIASAELLPDFSGEDWFALGCSEQDITSLGSELAHLYDKKACVLAESVRAMKIRIPIVVSASGQVINGIHRLFAAKEAGERTWPTITVPDEYAAVALNFLNYLSMDFHVDDDFARLMRYSAYRRPQNNRGNVPKAYRFWASGNKTLLDRDTYSPTFWQRFRELHGVSLLDFGAGLCKVKPFVEERGFSCSEFEPYRIDPESSVSVPDTDYSILMTKEFLDEIADGREFSSIFLASVLNSVPFPKDRMVVLAIVNALSSKDTCVYGTCRDISDFNYEYGGIRNANFFVFDSEPGVRLGDVMRNPKVQKFHTKEEADAMFVRLWDSRDYWPGGNVFYFKLSNPKGVNDKVLSAAIALEFNLPYGPSDKYPEGTTMGLVEYAKDAFSRRLGRTLP